jgi:D-inositol-3-phosphate glycosyltransferase
MSTLNQNRQAIALISDHGDPAADIGRDAAGGQNVYVRQVGEALAKLGWQVDMFTRKVNASDAAIVQHSPHCRTIRLVAGPQEFIPRDQLMSTMPAFIEAFQKFQAKEGLNYPLIHTNYWLSAWVGMQLKQRSNVQLIHTYHSLGAVKYQSVAPPESAGIRLAVEKQILETANCIVATSPQEEQMLRQLVSDAGNVQVIPCGTDLQNFRAVPRSAAREKLGFQPHEKIVLYVGRFDPRKGIETLVRAFAKLPPVNAAGESRKLVIVGGSEPGQADGIERQRIESIVASLNLADSVVFVGQVGHDLLPFYYTAADVCVIPSHYEPFGLVAIEAMACGTPVVASAVGGLNFTVLPEETGLLVPPHDVNAFAASIDRILSDELWAQKLRKRATERVQQNFSWSSVAVQLSDLYRRLLAQSLSGEFLMPTPRYGSPVTPISSSQKLPAKVRTKVS